MIDKTPIYLNEIKEMKGTDFKRCWYQIRHFNMMFSFVKLNNWDKRDERTIQLTTENLQIPDTLFTVQTNICIK